MFRKAWRDDVMKFGYEADLKAGNFKAAEHKDSSKILCDLFVVNNRGGNL